MARDIHCLITLATALVLVACEDTASLDETGPALEGSVTARVISTYGVDDTGPGINLPSGLQVFVADGLGQPVVDATVMVYPDGEGGEPMAHQGLGRYELDVLSGRLDEVDEEYFFEVISEWIYPDRIVLRVPHEVLEERPTIVAPAERSEHERNENLIVRWEGVEGADCYNLSTREHQLEPWELRQECLTDTLASFSGEEVRNFSYIRVRAMRELGDPERLEETFFSRSVSDAQVRIFLVSPED